MTNSKTVKIKAGAYNGTHEWMMKEYGSWEDHNCTEDHVCAILHREMDKPNIELTIEEAEKLLKSINYHCSVGWDIWDSPQQELAIKSTWRGYKSRLEKAIKKATQ